MRKGKVVLLWMGVKQVEVSGLPFVFKINCSEGMTSIPEELKRDLKLDYDTLKNRINIKVLKGTPSDDDKDVIFNGFIKFKEKEGLYGIYANNIRLAENGRLFSYAFLFSDRTMDGEYRIETFALKNGLILARGVDTITVSKIGLQAWLSELAGQHGLVYGIMAVVVAIAVGLSIGLIFKKGGGH
jgi:hypothetical protein